MESKQLQKHFLQMCSSGKLYRSSLSGDELWELSLSNLTSLIKDVKAVLKKDNDDDLSFLDETNTVDTINQLRFDILKDVYLTKKQEIEDEQNVGEIKAHNQKILSIIAEKEDEDLRNQSIDELKEQLL